MRLNRRSIHLTKSEHQGRKLPGIPERTKLFVRLLPAAQERLRNVAPGKPSFLLSISHRQTPEPSADCVNTAII